MKGYLYLFVGALLAGVAAASASAQVAAPTPSPDPHVYIDAAMRFTAPADAVLFAKTQPSLDELNNDLQVVATWVLRPGKEDARTIQLAMESYNGAPDQWESQFESQTHDSQDGTLIRGKTPMTLLNGMPAYFVQVAYGAGFDARKEFAIVWADGQRGIVLSETSRVGDATPEEAKRVLQDVSATRYPEDQP